MKITLQPGENLFFCSDPHFNHKNLCRGVSTWPKTNINYFLKATRNFQTLEDMNNELVYRINRVVGPNDHLFCLGDWSFGGIEQIYKFRKQINCKNIYLILGNHDHHIEKGRALPVEEGDYWSIDNNGIKSIFPSEIFKWIGHYLELEVSKTINSYTVFTKTIKGKFILCHYPIVSWNGLKDKVIQLHGHEHFEDENIFGPGKQMDVGFDGNPNFEPYSFEEVLNLMKERPVKTLYNYTHHENDF